MKNWSKKKFLTSGITISDNCWNDIWRTGNSSWSCKSPKRRATPTTLFSSPRSQTSFRTWSRICKTSKFSSQKSLYRISTSNWCSSNRSKPVLKRINKPLCRNSTGRRRRLCKNSNTKYIRYTLGLISLNNKTRNIFKKNNKSKLCWRLKRLRSSQENKKVWIWMRQMNQRTLNSL